MKTPYTARTYRAASSRPGEIAFQTLIEESDLWISCRKSYFDAEGNLPAKVAEKLREVRSSIKGWMRLQPEFGPSLAPVAVPEHAPDIVKKMALGGERWQVGPMAAVAGAVAEEVARAFKDGSPDFLVENGGDIFMYSSGPRTVALLPYPSEGTSIGIRLGAHLFPLSVCSSSSTIGHSLSFGSGELATVIARDAALADAAATSLCNKLKKPSDVELVINEAQKDPDVIGVFAQCEKQMGLWGDIELLVINGKD